MGSTVVVLLPLSGLFVWLGIEWRRRDRLRASLGAYKFLHRRHCLGEADTLGGDLRREGVEQAARERVEQHEDAAVVGTADEAAIGLAQLRAGEAPVVGAPAEGRTARLVADFGARPGAAGEGDEAQRAPRHAPPAQHP